ncbi:MAG: ribokinase [Solirubrobacteraceae bacterium]|nr:ribokinase [Solirubrobacteraceae bacterium]
MAVVGHVEWSQFVSLERHPAEGDVAHAQAWAERPGGGGTVAAVALAQLGATVDFYCALGADADGEATVEHLSARGVHMHVAWREAPTRRAITYLVAGGERTIVVIGPRLDLAGVDALDWERLDGTAGVYLTAGDAGAVAQARRAGVLVATSRVRAALEEAAVDLDALVYSEADAEEARWAQRLSDRARLTVATQGSAGGHWWGASEGRWEAAPAPGPVRDHYGAGDSFAAAFMYGLASGLSVAHAAALGARAGALALTQVGAP